MATVTILQPDHAHTIDRFDAWLTQCGITLETVHLWEDPVPTLADLGDGVILLGGFMSSHDGIDHPWIEPVGWLLKEAIHNHLPVLATGLGHQILAQAYGGHVAVPGPSGLEEGASELTLTDAALSDPIISHVAKNQVLMGFLSHSDAVERLPQDSRLLASSTAYNYQAFRIGSGLALQFHPEASPAQIARWHVAQGGEEEPLLSALQAVDGRVSFNGQRIAYAFAEQVGVQPPPIVR
ncbi:MAG: type 1 glutamine amidotransferase [Ancrocorticia sp.]|uniref:type 1 glutamine amidotransferase n=1 Tax=Ancrocorticia sp. TaxID=2593684 RepID=UPI003F8F6822